MQFPVLCNMNTLILLTAETCGHVVYIDHQDQKADHVQLTEDLKVNFYLGAHRTAAQHLFHTMAQHDDVLKQAGTHMPTMFETGRALSMVVQSLNQGRDLNAVRQDFFDMLLANATGEIKTLLIMSKGMLGPVQAPFSKDGIYGAAARRCQMLVELLQGFDTHFFMATRAPVPFAISCYGEAILTGHDKSIFEFMSEVPPNMLNWSTTIENILTVLPADRMTVWPFEDYPDIAAQLMSQLTNIEAAKFTKQIGRINVGLSLEGVELLREHIQDRPNLTPDDMRKLFDEYAEGYPSYELPRNHPVFTAQAIEHLKYAYEDDWYYIERIDGLTALLAKPTVGD